MPKRPVFFATVALFSLFLSACAQTPYSSSSQDHSRNSSTQIEVYGAIDGGVGQSKIYY